VALVGKGFALPGGAERLAGATARPNRSVVGPASHSKSERPPADAGEEVVLRVTPEIIRGNVTYVSLIHIPRRNAAFSNEISQPLRGVKVILVVISLSRGFCVHFS
jgi:hypothetical protein